MVMTGRFINLYWNYDFNNFFITYISFNQEGIIPVFSRKKGKKRSFFDLVYRPYNANFKSIEFDNIFYHMIKMFFLRITFNTF